MTERELNALRALAPEVAPESIEIVDPPPPPTRNVLCACVSRIHGVFRNYRVVIATQEAIGQ